MKFNDTSSFLEITPNVPIFLRSTSKGGFSAFADESLKNLNPVISFSPFSDQNIALHIEYPGDFRRKKAAGSVERGDVPGGEYCIY